MTAASLATPCRHPVLPHVAFPPSGSRVPLSRSTADSQRRGPGARVMVDSGGPRLGGAPRRSGAAAIEVLVGGGPLPVARTSRWRVAGVP
uniref:Uncharacterized protein n=1 Tax=Arundo donax TaxID=35708 RepID=A0A0A9BL23_ARUDO